MIFSDTAMGGVDEKDLIFAMGIRFWSNLVMTKNITDLKTCRDVLDTLMVLSDSEHSFSTHYYSTEQHEKNTESEETVTHAVAKTTQAEENNVLKFEVNGDFHFQENENITAIRLAFFIGYG